MDLFIVVIAILFVQVWGADNPLHRDGWFHSWVQYLSEKFSSDYVFAFGVGTPVAVVAASILVLGINSFWILLPVSVLLLLYSFGRGEFSEVIDEYTQACFQNNWQTGVDWARNLGIKTEDIDENDWITLHRHVLQFAAYRGFESVFAVLFWFFLLGPIAALIYRLIFLFDQSCEHKNPLAQKVLWFIEWPAVRVLGLSFALTGNFVGCIQRWRESAFSFSRPTQEALEQSVIGALSVREDLDQTYEVTRDELILLQKLYRRTLWFWLAAAAIVILLA